MTKRIDIDGLLAGVAEADNAALPFAKWKEDILERAAGYGGDTGVPIIAFDELEAARRRRSRAIRGFTAGAAGAAAVFIILLSVNERFGAGSSAPAPAPAAQSQHFSADADIGYENESAMPEAAALEPMAEAPEAAPSEIPPGLMMDEGGGNARGGDTGQAAPMISDPLLDEAILAVNEALNGLAPEAAPPDKGENSAASGKGPYAYSAFGESFDVTPLDGGDVMSLRLDIAYVVLLPDGSMYLVEPLSGGGVVVVGRIIT